MINIWKNFVRYISTTHYKYHNSQFYNKNILLFYYKMNNKQDKINKNKSNDKPVEKYDDKPEHHHTTIRKVFNKWSSKDIFKIAYNKMLGKKNKENNKKIKNVFIDSTFVDNKTGSELVGVNPLNYKKRVTKLSIICDNSKNILNIKEFKSTTNDCITIEKTLEGVRLKGRINLIGDKGYHVRQEVKEELRKRKIRLIVPRKKNQKKRCLRSKDRELLKERNKIENVIKMLKSINRISVRKDKRISNYLGFVWLGCGIKMYENNKIRQNELSYCVKKGHFDFYF